MTQFKNSSSAEKQEPDEADLTDQVGAFIEFFLTLDRWEREADRNEALRLLHDPYHKPSRCPAEFEGMCAECCATNCQQKRFLV
jgi:hypothetical protein